MIMDPWEPTADKRHLSLSLYLRCFRSLWCRSSFTLWPLGDVTGQHPPAHYLPVSPQRLLILFCHHHSSPESRYGADPSATRTDAHGRTQPFASLSVYVMTQMNRESSPLQRWIWFCQTFKSCSSEMTYDSLILNMLTLFIGWQHCWRL